MNRQQLVTETSDLIGFLPVDHDVLFDGGRFSVLDDYASSLQYIEACKNRDGYLYFIEKRGRTSQDVPQTERPAPLFRLPPSHHLVLAQRPEGNALRNRDGAFLMHLAGYLYGYRLQFHDWWFDGRVRMTSSHPLAFRYQAESLFLNRAFEKWRTWFPSTQKRFTNALYMLSRAEMYEWDWERFTIYYMVLDALYRTAQEVHNVPKTSHKKRLPTLCDRYGLYKNDVHIEKIVGLRNELFHESLWSGQQPCTAIREASYRQIDNLKRINQRLIPALVEFDTPYIASPWNSLALPLF
ncbi:MAG: hypothetical protein AB7G75_02800 [Candidatus Binatia bacterium]